MKPACLSGANKCFLIVIAFKNLS
uniref:Uncharacterized protein n=1 Tax=Anguilla anguilla TaxID=7936 RepID=A0A0E9VLD0_ANGAN